MQKAIGLLLVLAGMQVAAFAGEVTAPEIDAATAASGLAVLAGAVLIIRARRRK